MATKYRDFLLKYLDSGWEPVSEHDLWHHAHNGGAIPKKSLFVYHDMDLWKADHEQVISVELELGIRPHFMIHHPDDRRNKRFDAHAKVAALRARDDVSLCWHVNVYDKDNGILITPKEMKPESFKPHLNTQSTDMDAFIGAFGAFTIHGDPQRFNMSPGVLDFLEEEGLMSLDRVRKKYYDGRTDLRTMYITDSSGKIRRLVDPAAEGILFINTHCGNYDVEEVVP